MPRRLRLLDALAAADALIERGDRDPVEARDASSVILVDENSRRGRTALEAFLLVRHQTLTFAPGMAVFPGGGVDRRDFDGVADVIGPPPAAWARRLGLAESLAAALLCAAVRETFEETGVLLASADGRFVDTQEPRWLEIRRSLEAHEVAFSDVLAEHRLALRTDLLSPWARWTTPRFEKRRYRVWFFVARLPEGQTAASVSTESVSADWYDVGEAVAAADAGRLEMLPPQYYSLAELRDAGAPNAGLAPGRTLPDVEPRVAHDAGGAYLSLPPRILRHGPAAEGVDGRGNARPPQ